MQTKLYYAIEDLDVGSQKSARENESAWVYFTAEIQARSLGHNELADAWDMFLLGWKAHERACTPE